MGPKRLIWTPLDKPGHPLNYLSGTPQNGTLGGPFAPSVLAMADIWSMAKKALNWSPVTGYESNKLAHGVALNAHTALAPILPQDAAGASSTVNLSTALACPPVARALGLFSSAMFRHDYQGPADTLAWLAKPAAATSSKIRDVRTIQDLALANRALWLLDRDTDGTIISAEHLPLDRWSFEASEGHVIVGSDVVTDLESYIYFPGAMAVPFLEAAADTLAHYRDMTNTIKSRGRNPMPLVELALQEDYEGAEPGDDDYDPDFDAALNAAKSWSVARRAEDGAVAVTPRNIKATIHQPNDDGAMLIQARNAVRLDVGNHMNINAELVDGDNGASDTYSNSLQDQGDFRDNSLPLFMDPITTRLSMEDVSPGGAVSLVQRPKPQDRDAEFVGNTQPGKQPALTQNA